MSRISRDAYATILVGSRTYFPYIDGLRAVAVTSVIIYHLNAQWLPGGFAGVDVFFVISGFVVSASVGSITDGNFLRFLIHFYARRMARILPALVICLLATSLVSALLIPVSWLSDTSPKTGLFAFFGLSNFILAERASGYFSPIAEFNPYTHTWSLGVEEQFYLIFPAIFFAWVMARNARHYSLILVAAGLGASLAWAHWLGSTDPNTAFYMLASRFWELAAGVLLYQCMVASGHSFGSPAGPAGVVKQALALISLTIVAAGMVLASNPLRFPFPDAIVPVVGTLGVLGFFYGYERAGWLMCVLEYPAMRFIGKISYSLYLWHWPIFVIFRWTVGFESPVCQAAALLLTFGTSMASYQFIEKPFRSGAASKLIPKFGVVAAGVCVMAGGWWLSSKVVANQAAISLSTVTKNQIKWYPYGEDTNAALPGCRVAVDIKTSGVNTTIVYSPLNCASVPPNPNRLYVIGDSHAGVYMAMFKKFALDTGTTVHAESNSGCSFIGFKPETPACKERDAASLNNVLAEIKTDDIVFFPSLRLPHLTDQWNRQDRNIAFQRMFGPEAVEWRKRGEGDAVPILRAITAKGAKVVFEAPKPVFKTVAFRCSDWFNRNNPICADGPTIKRREIEDMRAPVLHAMENIRSRVDGVYVWDPLTILCPRAECSVYDGENPLFFDGDHISGYAGVKLAPSFTSFALGLMRSAPEIPRPAEPIKSCNESVSDSACMTDAQLIESLTSSTAPNVQALAAKRLADLIGERDALKHNPKASE